MKQSGLIIEYPKPTDYIAGRETTIRGIARVPDGNWTPFKNGDEAQSVISFDTQSCTAFSAINTIEMLMKFLPEDAKQALYKLGFNSNFECSKRFTAIVSGTTAQGNTFSNVAEAIRTKGVIPEADLPFGGSSFAEYHNPNVVTPAMYEKARKVLDIVLFKYDWVFFDGSPEFTTDQYTATAEALKTSPIQIGIQTPAYHAITLLELAKLNDKPYYTVFDHYAPYLRATYEYYPHFGMRFDVESKLTSVQTTTGYPEFTFTQYLVYGSTGLEVRMLQRVLIYEGFLKAGLDTGNMFNLTIQALRSFQAKYGIEAIGKVGPKTRAVLNDLCKKKL
jgi:hypothetical protein